MWAVSVVLVSKLLGPSYNKAKHLTAFPLLGLCACRYASATPTNYKAANVGGVIRRED